MVDLGYTKGPREAFLRRPGDASTDASLTIPSRRYLTLSRNWRAYDTIELRTPFYFYLDCVVDQPTLWACSDVPVLLAAEESGPRTDWRQVTLDAGDIGKSISGDPATLRFAIDGVVLKPFYETYGRHSVYLHVTLK